MKSSLFNTIKAKVYRPLLNSVSGIALSIFNPFKEGDFIEIDGQLGCVQNRGIRKTAIKNADKSIFKIDNRKFYFKKLHNLTSDNIIKLEVKLSVEIDSDMNEIKSEILKYISKQEKILLSPTPKIQVAKIRTEHIDLLISPWCHLDDYLHLDALLEERLSKHIAKRLIEPEVSESFIPEQTLMAS